MSPWPMMNEWGIPTFYLQSLANEFAGKLDKKGFRVRTLRWQVVSPMNLVYSRHWPWEAPISRQSAWAEDS